MTITPEIVEYIASLSRVSLTPELESKMTAELSGIVSYMDKLNEVNTTGIEPMSHVFELTNAFRADIPRPSHDREELLRTAPARTENAFCVPKTFD